MLQGTDEKALEYIQTQFPSYAPWMKSIFKPEIQQEKILFGIQSILGILLLAFCFFQLKRSRKGRIS